MRTRPTYTLLLFLGRPGRARARGPLPGTRPLGSRSRPRRASALGLRPPCAPWLTAQRGECARDDSSPGTGVSGTHLSPGCSLWKKERTWWQVASGGGGGGCACPGQSKLSSIATTKHAVRTVPAILLRGERGESGRVAAGAREVPGLGKPGSGPKELETCRYPAAAKVSSQLPGRWARAGTAWWLGAGRGWPYWGGARRDRAGRGEANRAARGRWWPRGQPAGAGLRELLGYRSVGIPQEPRERRTRSACGGSRPPSPAAGSPPLYTGRSGITTAEGLQARARWLASQQPSPLTGSERSSPASLLLPAAHWPTAEWAFPFRIFATSPSFLGVRGGPWPRYPPLPARSSSSLAPEPPKRSSSSAQNPPLFPALWGASLNSFSQRSSQTYPTNSHIQGSWGPLAERGWGSSHLPNLWIL